ncbi:MAG TPA: ComEC/Rec2 family competence protein [Longimicrobiales bacterium]|nr:ComEC/Rec2 family competence protein [Longimicrobiales bacterium]
MPIVHAAFGIAAGAALAQFLTLPGPLFSAAIVGSVIACLLLLQLRTSGCVLALYIALGVALGSGSAQEAAGDCRLSIPDAAAIRVTGRFTTLPDSGARALLHADELRGGGVTCRGVVLRVDLRVPLDDWDTRVRVEGTWLRWPDASVVQPERAGMVRARSVEAADEIAVRPWRERAQLDAQARVRTLYGGDAPLVEALLLARTETLPRDVRQRFADSGMVHLLAISGSHVVLILGVLLVLGQAVRLPPRAARVAALVGVVAYVIFLGSPPPAARAAVQLLLFSAGRSLQRPTDARGVLAASGLFLVAWQPGVVLDVGAQLSFAGVAGIVAFAPSIERVLQRTPPWFARPLAAGTAASITTLPIAGLHFGTLAPIGILAGLPGIPATGMAVPASALPLVLSYASNALASFFVPAAAVTLHTLDQIALVAAQVPGGHGFTSTSGVYALLLAGGAAIAAFRTVEPWFAAERAGSLPSTARDADGGCATAARFRHRAVGLLLPGLSAACAAVLVVALRPAAERAISGPTLELHVIDVGQGDAIAIRSPRGRWALIDAGPRGRSYDAGVTRVLPYLKRRQADALSVLVITHPDADHIGGAAATVRALSVHALLEPVQPDPRGMYLQTLDAARRRGTRLIAARAGTRIRMDGVEMEVLFPADRLAPPERANDNSAVILLRYGTFHALLLGDAPVAVEQWITRQYAGELRAQVLKVGHHGSTTSTGEALLDAVQPSLALIPVGRQNRYGHPAPDVLARLQRNRIAVLRTDERGAILVRADAHGRMSVETER